MVRPLTLLLVATAAACGGSSQTVPTPPPGEAHATPSPSPGGPAAPDVAPPAPGESASTPPPAPEEKPTLRPPPPAPEGVTFELKNDGDSDLVFSTTRGWQPVLFAYTGKPPKAKSVMLFPTACTASCDAGEAAVCPVCPPPKNKKEELAMAKSETAAAGTAIKVPWDGKVFAYEKASGKKKCKCWKKVDPAPDTYTIKACGLRPSKERGKPSKPVCTETQVALGGPDAPHTVTLSFGK